MQFFLKKKGSVGVPVATVINRGQGPGRGSRVDESARKSSTSHRLSARPSALRSELRHALDVFYGQAGLEDVVGLLRGSLCVVHASEEASVRKALRENPLIAHWQECMEQLVACFAQVC